MCLSRSVTMYPDNSARMCQDSLVPQCPDKSAALSPDRWQGKSAPTTPDNSARTSPANSAPPFPDSNAMKCQSSNVTMFQDNNVSLCHGSSVSRFLWNSVLLHRHPTEESNSLRHLVKTDKSKEHYVTHEHYSLYYHGPVKGSHQVIVNYLLLFISPQIKTTHISILNVNPTNC